MESVSKEVGLEGCLLAACRAEQPIFSRQLQQSLARHSKSSPATAEATMCFVDISDEAALFFRTFFALWTVIFALCSS